MRGADGGYFLARTPEQITLREVVEAFDKPSDFDLPTMPGFPSSARVRVAGVLRDMTEAGRAELEKLTLADLIRPASGGADD
jgi:DNA-binding IscR family transcriptional regulator